MDDDLNTPGAVGLLFTLVRKGNQALAIDDDDDGRPRRWPPCAEICAAVGLELERRRPARRSPTTSLALAAERDDARARPRTGRAPTRCATSSRRAGYIVEDSPGGTQLRRRA